MAWIKNVARKAEKKVFGSGGAKRRYGVGKGKGGFNFKNVLKDIEAIKGMLNVEKKSQSVDLASGQVGQVSGNADGNQFFDITPTIAQGTDDNQRIGNSLKITGMNFPIQLSSMDNTLGDRKLRVQIFKVNSADNGVTPDEMFSDYYDTNPLNGLRDINAPRKYRTAKQDGIKLIRTKYYKLKGIQVNTPNEDREKQCLTINLPLKMDEILRFDSNTNTQPDGTRFYMVLQCDAGNRQAVTTSTLDVPVKGVNSGVEYRICQKYWYVDN